MFKWKKRLKKELEEIENLDEDFTYTDELTESQLLDRKFILHTYQTILGLSQLLISKGLITSKEVDNAILNAQNHPVIKNIRDEINEQEKILKENKKDEV